MSAVHIVESCPALLLIDLRLFVLRINMSTSSWMARVLESQLHHGSETCLQLQGVEVPAKFAGGGGNTAIGVNDGPEDVPCQHRPFLSGLGLADRIAVSPGAFRLGGSRSHDLGSSLDSRPGGYVIRDAARVSCVGASLS